MACPYLHIDRTFSIDPLVYVFVLYSIFFATPLLFLLLYTIFKTSEREKEDRLQKEMKRKAREVVCESRSNKDTQAAPVTTR